MADLVLYTSAEVAELLRMNHQVVQRKLQAGEIPGYRIGREWRVEKAQLLEWLEKHSNQRDRSGTALFFDTDGRLRALPAQRTKRRQVLERLASELEQGRTYTEREVSTLLREFHDDVATLRREMVAERLVVRTKDGIYKRAAPREPALRRG